jgi:hypothetical protein
MPRQGNYCDVQLHEVPHAGLRVVDAPAVCTFAPMCMHVSGTAQAAAAGVVPLVPWCPRAGPGQQAQHAAQQACARAYFTIRG